MVTGLGPVTCIGTGLAAFWPNLVAGKSGVVANDLFDCSQISSRIIAPVSDFEPETYMTGKAAKRTDRFAQFAVAATHLAMADASLPLEEHSPRRGVYIGTAFGGVTTMIGGCRTMYDQGLGRVSAFTVQMMLSNIAVGHVARLIGAHGHNEGCHTACASGSNAVGDAFVNIRRGILDVAVAGGTEAPLVPLIIGGISNMHASSRRNDEPAKASRPFDRDRDGFVPAEGAGMLVLEELEHARNRGARIYAEMIGYGNSNDAFDPVQPAPQGAGAALAMARALDDASLCAHEVDYINAHATSTRAGDIAENDAIISIFGEHAGNVPISATKSMTGHMLGAAGAIDAISTAMSLQTGFLPPSINLDNIDEGFELNYVPHAAISQPISRAISNSFGFGGQNATLVMARYEP